MANVYVYIKDGSAITVIPRLLQPHSTSADAVTCRTSRHDGGQTLKVLNSDRALHNIHSMAHENEGWNESQYPGVAAIEKKFTKPELMVPVQCNNHPWMKMYVNVSPHPFFAVTNAEGKFTISGLPPGTYTLAALHEKMGEKTMQITVGPKADITASLAFSSADLK